MTIQLVPARDDRCDVCEGDRDHPKPRPGERWNAREPFRHVCMDCYNDFGRDLWLGEEINGLEPPPDPRSN